MGVLLGLLRAVIQLGCGCSLNAGNVESKTIQYYSPQNKPSFSRSDLKQQNRFTVETNLQSPSYCLLVPQCPQLINISTRELCAILL